VRRLTFCPGKRQGAARTALDQVQCDVPPQKWDCAFVTAWNTFPVPYLQAESQLVPSSPTLASDWIYTGCSAWVYSVSLPRGSEIMKAKLHSGYLQRKNKLHSELLQRRKTAMNATCRLSPVSFDIRRHYLCPQTALYKNGNSFFWICNFGTKITCLWIQAVMYSHTMHFWKNNSTFQFGFYNFYQNCFSIKQNFLGRLSNELTCRINDVIICSVQH